MTARLPTVLRFVLLVLLCLGAPLAAGSAQDFTSSISDDPDYIERAAAADRSFAQGLLDRAGQWRAMANNASANAAATDDPEFRKSWNESAATDNRQAQQLEDYAREINQRADREEKQAAAQRAKRAAAATPAPQPQPTPAPAAPATASTEPGTANLVSFVGVWENKDHNVRFALQTDTGELSSNRIRLTGLKVKWNDGLFEPGNDSRPSRFTFAYKPKASEMNKEIPEAVRRSVEGKLEWKLEFKHDEATCVCSDGRMQSTWYPGEVSWGDDDKGTVTGPGKPVTFDIDRLDPDSDMGASFAPTIIVHVGDPARARVTPVTYLVKGQRFEAQVRMSKEQAKSVGDTLRLKIHGAVGDATDTIDLHIAPQTRNASVVRYEHTGKLTIDTYGQSKDRKGFTGEYNADNPFFNASDWASYIIGMDGPQPGSRLSLSVANGEKVEFSLPDLEGPYVSLRVYDTELRLILARYDDAFVNLQQTFATVLAKAGATTDQRTEATHRLRMIQNARAFINDVDKDPLSIDLTKLNWTGETSYAVQDRVRIDIARTYYDELILGAGHRWYGGSPQDKGGPASPPAYGGSIVWASFEEAQAISSGIIHNDDYRFRLNQEITSAGLRAGSAAAIPLAEFVVYGVPTMVFHLTPLGDAYIVFTGQDILGNKVDLSQRVASALGLGLSAFSFGLDLANAVREATASSRAVSRLGRATEIREVIDAGAAGRATFMAAEAAAEGVMSGSAAVRSSKTLAAGASSVEDMALLYPRAQFLDAPKELHAFKQKGPTCRFAAQEVLYFRDKGITMLPNEGIQLRADMKIAEATQITGATNIQVMNYTNVLGGRTVPTWTTPAALAVYHRNGAAVSVNIWLQAREGFHQVAVWEIEFGTIAGRENRPLNFILHDTNYPDKLIKVSAKEFEAMLVTQDQAFLKIEMTEISPGNFKMTEQNVRATANADVTRYPKVLDP